MFASPFETSLFPVVAEALDYFAPPSTFGWNIINWDLHLGAIEDVYIGQGFTCSQNAVRSKPLNPVVPHITPPRNPLQLKTPRFRI